MDEEPGHLDAEGEKILQKGEGGGCAVLQQEEAGHHQKLTYI